MSSIQDLIKQARARIAMEEKRAFAPMGPQGSPPTPPPDPSMMGGAPPPMGGMPPDPSMMGGAPPMPPGGAPGGQPVMLSMDDLLQLFTMISEGDAKAPTSAKKAAPNEAATPDGGHGAAVEGKLDDLSVKLDQLMELLGGGGGGVNGLMPPEAMAMPEAGMDLGLGAAPETMGMGAAPMTGGMPTPELPGGSVPPGVPGAAPPMTAAASVGSKKASAALASRTSQLQRILRNLRA